MWAALEAAYFPLSGLDRTQVMKLTRKYILPALSGGGSKLLALALHVCSLALHEDMR